MRKTRFPDQLRTQTFFQTGENQRWGAPLGVGGGRWGVGAPVMAPTGGSWNQSRGLEAGEPSAAKYP